jgi:hypothetical protein
MESKIKISERKSTAFSTDTWNSISQLVAEAHRLSLGELDRLRKTAAARLIAAIPYLAGCSDPDRFAVANVGTFLLAESAESIFDHRDNDDGDVPARLATIALFPDGDQAVIRRGINLLALTMVCHYEQTRETDRARGVYNPLVSGAWDAESVKSRLVKEIRAVASPEMDAVYAIEQALIGRWNNGVDH